MKTCIICRGEQDTKLFDKYNICTECADIIEDIMSEYFFKIVNHRVKNPRENYARYLQDIKQHPSNYAKIKKGTEKHHKHIEDNIKKELAKEHSAPEERYLTRILCTTYWLEQNPDFYPYYFEQYYLCPTCKESLFENYKAEQTENWFIIQCGNCGTTVKKYFSPTLHRLTHHSHRTLTTQK